MAKLEDFGIRFISHGCWGDPEVEWRKSDHQKLFFNYWDVAEHGDFDDLDLTNEWDIKELRQWLWELTPSEYAIPDIDYSWVIYLPDEDYEEGYDHFDYYKDYKLSKENDFVLHNSSQALYQALSYINDRDIRNAYIEIYRREPASRKLVAEYRLQGSTLKDVHRYKKR